MRLKQRVQTWRWDQGQCARLIALVVNGKIKTTHAKAKELRPAIEKMITRAKVKTPYNIRLIRKTLAEKVTKKLFGEIAAKYQDRAGGYTRIIRLGQRKSDSSSMAHIEFI